MNINLYVLADGNLTKQEAAEGKMLPNLGFHSEKHLEVKWKQENRMKTDLVIAPKFHGGRLIDGVTGKDITDGKEFVWDPKMPGFGVRKGKSTRWVVQYRVNGKERRKSLGDISKVPEAIARNEAIILFGKAAQGVDPIVEKEKHQADRKAEKITFSVLVKRYLAFKVGIVRPNTFSHQKRHLTANFKALDNKRIDAIKRVDIAECLHQIVEKSAKMSRLRFSPNAALAGRNEARASRGSIGTFFKWALGEGLVENNPVIGTNDPGKGLRSRTRILSDAELHVVWNECEENERNFLTRYPDFGRIVQLLILTGARRMEIGSLKWSEINIGTGSKSLKSGCTLTISGDRIKNHKPLILPLPPLAANIIRKVPRREGRDYLFGYSKDDKSAFGNYTYANSVLLRRIADKGIKMEPWVLHDLRRTFRTGLVRLGVAPHVAERCLNHVKGGMEGVYDQYHYQPEIEDALLKWADHVAKVVKR